MNSRTFALGLFLSLALVGCGMAPIKGNYNFAEHPGKGLVVFSTRMSAGNVCPLEKVTGDLIFAASPGKGSDDLHFFALQVPRPERKVSTFSEMSGDEERTVPADPPTLFAVQELPAGRYVLDSMRVLLPEHTRASYINKDPIPASFTVNEGEVVYLGELGVTLTGARCVPGSTYFFDYFELLIRDEWERDRKRFPGVIHNLSPDAVQKRLLELR